MHPYGDVGRRPTIVFGGGDGFCYGFDPQPDPAGTLKELWRFDCNPAEYRQRDGKAIKYGKSKGPSEIMATPVIFDIRVFLAIGQNPDNGVGAGCFNCIQVDYNNAGQATPSALWRNTTVGRSMSTCSVTSRALFVSDLEGILHCLNPQTGAVCWTHDMEAQTWSSTLVANDKIYVEPEIGEMHILSATAQKQLLGKVDFNTTLNSTPVAANGTLYVATNSHLYALQKQ